MVIQSWGDEVELVKLSRGCAGITITCDGRTDAIGRSIAVQFSSHLWVMLLDAVNDDCENVKGMDCLPLDRHSELALNW